MRNLVIVPTYNERDNIKELIQKILEFSPQIHILVIDDNSPDGTGKIVESLMSRIPNLYFINRTSRKGRGLAGIEGFKFALENNFDYIIEMDADFSHSPEYIPEFLKHIQDADIVIGSRFIKQAAILNRGLGRNIISLIANLYTRIILGILDIRDVTSGYRCYKTTVFKQIGLEHLISGGPSILEEILFRAKRHKLKIKEIPIIFVHRKSGKSKLNFKILFNTFLTILRLRIFYYA
jgi:dolichol-phosphate mannosyltransferase